MILERRIWNIGNLFALLLLVLTFRIVYWQMVRGGELTPLILDPVAAAASYSTEEGTTPSDQGALDYLAGASGLTDLQSLPQPVIQRTMDLLRTITRGSIYDRNGRLLAYDGENPDGERLRFYTEPSLAHVIGYTSGLRTGITGLELSYNTVLLGLNRVDARLGQILHQPIQGSDIILTIDSQVQRAAEKALEGHAGAIVVLDSRSGAVLAMVSAPRFDPNLILNEGYLDGLLESCADAIECRAPLINRATQGSYTPGSTWKTVTLIGALDRGQVTPETVFDFGEPRTGENGIYYVYEVDGGVIPDPNHRESLLNLELSYAKSANAAFARIGDEMPPDVMVDYASRLGFSRPEDARYPIEVDYTPSVLARDVNSLYDNNLLRAVTAIGQGELLTSPLNMAMVVLTVLNDGNMPIPYFVESIREPGGGISNGQVKGQVLGGVMKPETADTVRQMMISVVEKGSAGRASVPGLMVGGKTGTAQVGGSQLPHAWFTGFAEDNERSVVIVVLVENAGEGSRIAAPIFAEIAQAALGSMGQPVEEIVPQLLPTARPPEEPPLEEAPPEEPGETPASVATPTPEETPLETPAPELAATPTENPFPGIPTPEIYRDPTKADLTAGSASCVVTREGVEGTGTFIWPSQYQALSGGDFKIGHPGLDLSSPSGSPVYAADTGVVIFAGWTGGVGYGNAILIDHGNGYQTLYAHLSQVSIHCGAKVDQGKVIGLSGNTGNSTGAHLHFEVRVPGGYINPLRVLPTP
jgi:penicillin-binding protein A